MGPLWDELWTASGIPWDLPTIGRVAILICFDINFYELWHQAYALGAQVVFWPSMMATPDRDAMSLARLFRFHVVANGSPGAIHDPTGHMVPDLKTIGEDGAGWVVTGTMDLDASWLAPIEAFAVVNDRACR